MLAQELLDSEEAEQKAEVRGLHAHWFPCKAEH